VGEEQSNEAPIVPVEQKTIEFYGDELVAVRDEEDTVWVPVRHICERLGVDWGSQRRRILNDPVLSEEMRFVVLTPRTKGGRPEVLALPVKYIRFWLAQINASRVRDDLAPVVIRYQREVADVIDRHFARTAPIVPADADEAHMVAMRDLARQQADLMRQQAELWDAMLAERRRLTAVQLLAEDHEGMIQDLARQMDQVRQELSQVQGEVLRLQRTETGQLRLLLPPSETRINPEQKATIRGLVEDLVTAADARGVRLWASRGKNNYQSVYATLNRTFNVAKYEELTQAQYPKAVEWLKREIAKVEAREG